MDNGKTVLKSRIDYGWARPEEWTDSISLVWTTFMEFEAEDYGSEGVGHFFEFVTDDDLHKAFLNGNYPMIVARLDHRSWFAPEYKQAVSFVRAERIPSDGHRNGDSGQAVQVSEGCLSRKYDGGQSGTVCR